jgi:hypothetical protein
MNRPRDIQAFPIAWQGIAITVTCERNALALADAGVATSAHLAITAANRRPLPFTETGYRSVFVDPADIDAAGGPVAYVTAWLDLAAQSPQWRTRAMAAEQLSLF